MAQLIVLLIIVVVAWLGYRKFVADAERLTRQRRNAEKERETGAVGTLVKDPKTGEYRLRRDDE
jgi:membrane protein implicated in regulation of membrane protease activity